MKYHLVTKFEDIDGFKYCPFCGSKDDYLGLYIGDFTAHTECLNCDQSIGFYILNEIEARFPDKWNKMVCEM